MSKLGMVRVKGTLCRTRRGKFTKCRKPIAKGRGKGFAKKHTRGIKGRCVKWSKGRTRCVRRANPGLGYKKRKASGGRKSGARRATSRVTKGRCVKWSKGRKRCLKRIRHNADGSSSIA